MRFRRFVLPVALVCSLSCSATHHRASANRPDRLLVDSYTNMQLEDIVKRLRAPEVSKRVAAAKELKRAAEQGADLSSFLEEIKQAFNDESPDVRAFTAFAVARYYINQRAWRELQELFAQYYGLAHTTREFSYVCQGIQIAISRTAIEGIEVPDFIWSIPTRPLEYP